MSERTNPSGVSEDVGEGGAADLIILTDINEDRVRGQLGPAQSSRSHVDGVLDVVVAVGVQLRDRRPARDL